jgi:signal transduction histidine kinase
MPGAREHAREGGHPLTNVVKHPDASHARIWLLPAAAMPCGLPLEISGDGTGFDSSLSWPGHLGLKTMQQRVERLGGNLAVRSTPACGTTIQALVLVCTAARPGSPRLEGCT